MYNLKKVIASICVIAMMLTTVAFGATFDDVAEDSAYYEAVETLNKLGIIKGKAEGQYAPEDNVTRAEMAALIARIQGFGASAEAQIATDFTDVPATHWASGYVASAASMGIINGYGDGKFGPDDNVLFEQAVKMIMATLGYTPYAEYNGGYPGGFIAAAQRYNVTAGVSNATMGTQANRGTVAQLLANAIDTPLMQQTGWTTNGEVEYVINDGKNNNDYKTLMSENLGVVKIRGILAENAYTSLEGNKDINTEDDATVEIYVSDAFDTSNKDFTDKDGELRSDCPTTYYVGESDANDFIGRSVIAYVQEVDNDYEVVSIVLDTARNDELTIDLSQFNDIKDGKFEYYKTATAKTATAVNLDKNGVEVVYNNVGGYDLDVFGDKVAKNGETLNGGKITLVDNNETKGYDVIFVEIAETVVVDEAEEGYVTFKPGAVTFSELEQDEDDTEKIVKVTKDGEEIALADLVEWDVLSIIAENEKANYILAEVVSNKVVGTITSQAKSTTSATDLKYTIDGAKYDVAEGAYGVDNIAVGDGGTFYIDKYGKIAAFNEDAALASGIAANYGYVTAATVDVDVLTNKNTAIIQMVTADGLVALEMKATGAKFEGETFDADDFTAKEIEDELKGELVKFSKNSSGKITALDIVKNGVDEVVGGKVDASAEYDAEDNRFIGDDGFFMDANSYVFFIAEDADDCYFGSEADLVDGEIYKVISKFADKKADDNNIVVVEALVGKAGVKTGLAVITSVGTSENEDAETIFAIEALMNGETIVADTTGDVYSEVATKKVADKNVDYLTVGDIVKIKVGADNVISAINVVYDFDGDVRNMAAEEVADFAVEFEKKYEDGKKEEIVGGKVTNYRKTSSTAEIAGDEYKLSQASNIIVIDPNGRDVEIRKGSASNFKYFEKLYAGKDVTVEVEANDINDKVSASEAQKAADYVFVRRYDSKVTDVVIVKGHEDLKIK